MKYIVEISRWDCPTEKQSFNAGDDEAAQKHFEEKYLKDKSHAWDDLILYRIDQEEKRTLINSNYKNQS